VGTFELWERRRAGVKLDRMLLWPARRGLVEMAGRPGAEIGGKRLVRVALPQNERQGNQHHQEGCRNDGDAPQVLAYVFVLRGVVRRCHLAGGG